MNSSFVKIRLRHPSGDADRYGNARFYVRLPGRPKVRVRGVPGSEEFMRAYHAAITGAAAKVAARGSFRHLCRLYFGSETFKALDVATQNWRRWALENICERYGDNPVVMMQERHVGKIVQERADKPMAAKKRLRAMQALFKWGAANESLSRNPARDVMPVAYREEGHHTWTIDEVEAFEARHPLGTRLGWRWRCCFTQPAAVRTWCGLVHNIRGVGGSGLHRPKMA